MIRRLRILARIMVGILELLMAFAFISVLPKWVKGQEQRYHPASDPAAIALHERHLRVSGTATAPAHHHSIVETRMGDGSVSRTETYTSQPDRVWVRSTIADKLVMEFGYDGTTGWSNSPQTGLTRLRDAALAAMREVAGAASTPAIVPTTRLVTMGRHTFDGQPADAIRMITAAGDTAESYYAVSTGLMIGMRMWQSTGPMKDTVHMMLRDYRPVGGRQEFFTIVSRMGAMEMVTKTLVLEHTPVDPVRFKPPAGLP